jgi:hypothetical protein
MDIYSLKVPTILLRSIKEIPLFQWARIREVKVWEELANAYKAKSKLPDPPPIDQNCWAPSGMENMDAAFRWAISSSKDASAELWKFYYGAWLAGRGATDDAIKTLSECNIGVSKVLLARLLKLKGNNQEAAIVMESVLEPWLQLHPQVVVERDKILRSLGPSTIAKREQWLLQVAELKDEWVIERRVQLLIDKGEWQQAKLLLLSVPFQKVHQTYTRTGLWKQLSDKMNTPFLPIPSSLGEDKLANFGAYREYE